MNLPPKTEAGRGSSFDAAGTNRGTRPAVNEQSPRGQGQAQARRDSGTTTMSRSGAAGRGPAADHNLLFNPNPALHAMESMSLTSPSPHNAPPRNALAAAAAASTTAANSWNESPAMLHRELAVARIQSAQARAREVELHHRLQALSPSGTAAPAAPTGMVLSPSYLRSTVGLMEPSSLYGGQLGLSAQGIPYMYSATRGLPLHGDQQGASMFANAIPPPPLADSSARGQPSAYPGVTRLSAASGSALDGSSLSIQHHSSLLAAQERAELLRRLQQAQPIVSAAPMMLSPIYGMGPGFHSAAALLAAQQQSQSIPVLQVPSVGAAASAVTYGGIPWVQTNVSVAEASPTRSLRMVHPGLGPGIGASNPAVDATASPSYSGGRTFGGGGGNVPAMAAAATRSVPGEEGDEEDKPAYEVRGTFVDEITELDVLCGRGGRSNHWPGNKRYRRVIKEMKNTYKSSEGRKSKTGLSRAIVDHVLGYGGRFVREEDESGRYYVLTKAESRVKTSQALREGKDLKWTR